MKLALTTAIALLALPLSAIAGPQQKTDMEDALRQQQLLCAGMMDINARTGGYNSHELAQCLVTLESQRTAYQRFIGASTASAR